MLKGIRMHRALFWMAISTLWFAGDAFAQGAPHIVSVPDGDQFSQYFPERAQRFEISGKARMQCVADAGQLAACQLIHEWPAGFGFGDAALKLAHLFRTSGAGPVTVPINFRIAPDGPGTAYATFAAADPKAPKRGRLLNLTSTPTAAQILAAYPVGATAVVSVMLECGVDGGGRLKTCAATERWSDDPRFVQAALALAPIYKAAGPTTDLADATVTISIVFIPPDPG
jgi:hypothetical protein